jgi:hypothetical protein
MISIATPMLRIGIRSAAVAELDRQPNERALTRVRRTRWLTAVA